MLTKITDFFKEIHLEIKKVNWLTREQAIKYTLIVIGFSMTVAIFLGSLDALFTAILNRFLL